MFLFGFGSLINLKSAQKSFKRVLKQEELIPVQIKGYERIWNAIESIQFEGMAVNGIFLNLQKNQNSTVYGVAIKITSDELELLKLREKNYSCIEIDSSQVVNKTFDEPLIAFMTTKEEKIAKKGDENCYIPTKYIDILLEGLKNYDSDFVNDVNKSLKTFPFALKEGNYGFTDPIQQAAAREGIKSDKNQ